MTAMLETWRNRLTVTTLSLALFSAALAFMDTRHALASDVKALIGALSQDRFDRIEERIEDTERRWQYLTSIPPDNLTPWQANQIRETEILRERYLRKLKELQKK